MRKILLYIIITFASTLIASEVNWAKDFKAGIKEASRFNKPVLFISSRHTCRYCVILDNTTLKNKKVIDALNKDFVSIISYSDENDYIPRELYQPGTPAIWFLLPSSEPMYQPIMGAIRAKDFLEALSVVKKEFDSSKKRGK
ncbi:DUF255 domain-containing protein [Sulfurimonas sp.]|uniref:DUF255 domain-containing protein n=1 Tax=Sulfurimonas sp. TaxID=2022749 RepID=UPI002B4742DA|nr:DUF255 domain-containing protein [Sulfurimonas sp.]